MVIIFSYASLFILYKGEIFFVKKIYFFLNYCIFEIFLIILLSTLDFVACLFNLYLFQVNKEKQAIPVVQLNVIRLLADLNVAVKKSEVVDMILPLFVESLEEGDASTPSLLRLRVWNLCLLSMYLLM